MSVYGHLLEEGVGEALDMTEILDTANVVDLKAARRKRGKAEPEVEEASG
jgi:hypothetical protein